MTAAATNKDLYKWLAALALAIIIPVVFAGS